MLGRSRDGFGRPAGFIDDTRGLGSTPARHDMSRRPDAGHLARPVATRRPDEGEAAETPTTLAGDQPRRVFEL